MLLLMIPYIQIPQSKSLESKSCSLVQFFSQFRLSCFLSFISFILSILWLVQLFFPLVVYTSCLVYFPFICCFLLFVLKLLTIFFVHSFFYFFFSLGSLKSLWIWHATRWFLIASFIFAKLGNPVRPLLFSLYFPWLHRIGLVQEKLNGSRMDAC